MNFSVSVLPFFIIALFTFFAIRYLRSLDGEAVSIRDIKKFLVFFVASMLVVLLFDIYERQRDRHYEDYCHYQDDVITYDSCVAFGDIGGSLVTEAVIAGDDAVYVFYHHKWKYPFVEMWGTAKISKSGYVVSKNISGKPPQDVLDKYDSITDILSNDREIIWFR